MSTKVKVYFTLIIMGLSIYAGQLKAGDGAIIVQSTTSTANSGLYDYLLPTFRQEKGVRVHVVAVGTGQAIKNAKNCDGDVLLVHARAAEQQFVEEGYGVERFDVMYNDFVIVGPQSDPANIRSASSVESALAKIAASGAFFLSRGDQSGTHKKELALWRDSGINPLPDSGRWYRESGSGMGATLNVTVGMQAYTLTDRATWISFANQQDFSILYEGDDNLFNQYGVIKVNPERCQQVNSVDAQVFIDWILSENGQKAIQQYELKGKQLFFPNAKRQ